MRYFILSLFLLLFSAQHVPDVHAQNNSLKHDNLTELGDGLFVETIPAHIFSLPMIMPHQPQSK